ncbi:tricarballylate utilization 4Fe-4S protein TcuB [Rhabdochromatium marinum]|uniref:tricarballylate utilization 4Fe-4S protein TcuB n=1 Tax=Rhabdochromatium marinum TaxID=48729 RepID=UPI0019083F70|nr:tricarballylate utilization 4Fe-4S protein TcuB [Rhabdochromatium marinum]MBK1648634.1 hypothetical protein [Rhabdochromatium marinum]
MHAAANETDSVIEARRVLNLCNICGYCNGFCDLFDAARECPTLSSADLERLAHLCHACRNCLEACQYAPPHAFNINVPRTLERLRDHSYATRVWPPALASLLRTPQRWLLGILTAIILCSLLGIWLIPGASLLTSAQMPGDFYQIVPFPIMAGLAGLSLGWALLAISISLSRYWRAISHQAPAGPLTWSQLTATLRGLLADVVKLRNLQGGGIGCTDSHSRLAPARRWLHQLLVLGLLSCLAATLAAAFWHHVLEQLAPYPLSSPPVVLGLLGGLLMLSASLGLLWIKRHTNPLALTPEGRAADQVLIALLLIVVLTGLALLLWRATPAMGLLLLVHLGSVYGFFVLLPASKLVHAGYRLLTLLRLRLDR